MVIFTLEWLVLAYAPLDREAWLLENLLAVLFILLIVGTYKAFPLSRISYTLIFLFMALHEIGAHYTYAKVPYDAWWQEVFGYSLNQVFGFERNHFDRLVHFSYGLLLAYPIREVFIRIVGVRGFWAYFLPLDLTMSTSMIFELLNGQRRQPLVASWPWTISVYRAISGMPIKTWPWPVSAPWWRCWLPP